jgi:hypothetical protein
VYAFRLPSTGTDADEEDEPGPDEDDDVDDESVAIVFQTIRWTAAAKADLLQSPPVFFRL